MIAVKNLSFNYPKKQKVLEGLNLELKPGHIYGLLGRNGAGKSSLLHNLCGLLFPTEGVLRVLGEEPRKRSPKLLSQIYLLPEELDLPDMRVSQYRNIYSPFYPAFDSAMFKKLLSEFEISETDKLNDLSLGQKKKVAISFALATQAKVLLLDEPTNGLDIPSKKQFRKILAGALKEDQIIIISTHQVKDLDNLIDTVLILDSKQIVINESVESITEKLVFKHLSTLEGAQNVLYSEGGLKGHAVVAENKFNEFSKLDMEIFFNAAMAEKQRIQLLFTK